MALNRLKLRYIPKENIFYRDYYHYFIIFLMVLIIVVICSVGFLLYELSHQRLPEFSAIQPKGQTLALQPYLEPNLLPDTIIRFASKAAVAAYSFDFVNYKEDLQLARPFFTDTGWQGYLNAAQGLINTIVSSQLFVYGIVSGTPVIANQGVLPGSGFTWRIQIPFLVTYETATGPVNRNYFIIVRVVRVPTSQNPQGIGIDQFTVI
jgi:intracellular multiplication protein IcmL